MRVRILSPYPNDIAHIFAREIMPEDSIVFDYDSADYVICFGHRELIPPSIIAKFPNRILNLHISLLPWNRGADPNFWSWFDNTPKGVSIHLLDEGIDTGPLLAQAHVDMLNYETLETSYWRLRRAAVRLLEEIWPNLPEPIPQRGIPTSHTLRDKALLWNRLPLGWQTPCSVVEQLGIASRTLHESL